MLHVTRSQKTDASAPPNLPHYNSPSLFDTFPPVPPIPAEHQRTPVGSPIADVFITPPNSRPLSLSTGKPLPPIMGQPSEPSIRDRDDADERSMVFVEKVPRTPSPDPKVFSKSVADSSKCLDPNRTLKRRSMSVGDAELKRIMSTSSTVHGPPQPPGRRWTEEPLGKEDTTLNGILTEFKGELSQLDPISSSALDLRDPSTPSRQAAYSRSQTDGHLLLSDGRSDRNDSPSSSKHSLVPPTLTLQSPPQAEESRPAPEAIVPPRFSSLTTTTPVRSASALPLTGSPLLASPRPGLSPRSRSGNPKVLHAASPNRRDSAGSARLRVMHRSTASSSEPSLIPNGDDARVCKHHHSKSPNGIECLPIHSTPRRSSFAARPDG